MTYEERKAQNEKLSNFAYYILIGVISIISTTFLPMIGTELGLDIPWPNTWFGWIIWITARVGVAIVNMLLFYCFIAQGRINIKDDPAYKEANELLKKYQKSFELKARSPKKFLGGIWASKGTSVFFGSIISTMVLTEALLKFDVMNFLTYIFTVAMGIVFGYVEMRKVEDYWVTEFPVWAREEVKKIQLNETSEETSENIEMEVKEDDSIRQ